MIILRSLVVPRNKVDVKTVAARWCKALCAGWKEGGAEITF